MQVHLLSNRAEQEVVCLGRGQDLGGDYENRETGDCLKSKQCNFFIQKAEVKIVLKQLTVRSRLRPTQIFFYCKEGLNFTIYVHCTAGVVRRRVCAFARRV